MNWIGRSRTVKGSLLALALLVTGCTIASGTMPITNSHFVYPNSNVIPLGEGKGEASDASLFTFDLMDPALMEEAVQAAITTKGGDLLIDYDLYFKIIQIPIPIFAIYVTTWGAEGTVAKMEIGKQILR